MTYRRSALLIGLLVIASAAHFRGGGIIAGPYLQDPSPSSMWVCWETSSNTESIVEYGTSPLLGSSAAGTNLTSSASTIIHQVLVTGLQPSTTYWYRARTGSWFSAVSHFQTPPAQSSEASWRFVALSDTQIDGGNPQKHREVIEQGVMAYTAAQYGSDMSKELAFLINIGDLVSTGSNHSHWVDHYFAQAQSLYELIPSYSVLGNHEADANLYYEYLRLPHNSQAGSEERYWWADRQNVRLIGLDSNGYTSTSEQLTWLDGVLANTAANDKIDFVFCLFHHPHLSELWTPGESGFSSNVVARLEQFSDDSGKPSVHFFGHTHGYSRGQSQDHNHLMVNVATGMGNPDYWYEYSQADYPEFQYSEPDWGFCMIDVTAGSDPSFRLRRLSRGNEYVSKNNTLSDEITIRRYNTPPDKPQALLPNPASGDQNAASVELIGSSFNDPDGDTLLEAQYQVTETLGDWSNLITDDWRRIENWYRPANGDGWYSENNVTDSQIEDIYLNETLPGCRDVYWRVRYRDSALAWSEWSDPQQFHTGASSSGNAAPEPNDGEENISLAPTLRWFPCSTPDAYDVYFGTDATPDASEFQGQQGNTTFQPGVLQPETTYYWRIDMVTLGLPETGEVWQFTTSEIIPTEFTAEWRFDDASPATGVALIPTMGNTVLTPRGMSYGSDWTLEPTGGAVPHIDGIQANCIHLDEVSGSNTGLEMFYGAPGNGGGGCCDVFHFTFIWDLFIPSGYTELQALWQGNASNSNDAEVFLNAGNGGFYSGGSGYVGGSDWSTGEWVRITNRVNYADNTSAIFVNGTKVLSDDELSAPDWLYAAGSGNPDWILTDDDGGNDVGEVWCANFAIVDALMSDQDIANLGSPDARGIFLPGGATPYCTGAPNTAGLGAILDWSGTTSVTANDLRLYCYGGIPNQYGIFFYGAGATQTPFGHGFRCVSAGGIGLFRIPPAQQFDFYGDAYLTPFLDLAPANSGPGAITPGSTRYFQFWYRDPAAGPPGFNLSSALAIDFEP
jgi:hypothetical protein